MFKSCTFILQAYLSAYKKNGEKKKKKKAGKCLPVKESGSEGSPDNVLLLPCTVFLLVMTFINAYNTELWHFSKEG